MKIGDFAEKVLNEFNFGLIFEEMLCLSHFTQKFWGFIDFSLIFI